LACFYHRIAAKAGTGKAVVAVCRKLSMIYYNVLTYGKDYVDVGQSVYKKNLEEKEKRLLVKLAKKHNMLVVQS